MEPCTEEGDYPDWDLVDGSLRVLYATRPADGSTIATLVNFAAHSTVMGSSNTLISATGQVRPGRRSRPRSAAPRS